MLEIIALIFIGKYIKKLSLQKGLKPTIWKTYTFICWFVFEILGLIAGLLIFGSENFFGLMLLGLACAFGGFLIILFILQNKPDAIINDEINRIGTND